MTGKQRILAVFGFKRIDMNRPVRRLRGDILIQGVPSHSLDIVTVLSNLPYQGPGCCIIDPGHVVHAADNEMYGIR